MSIDRKSQPDTLLRPRRVTSGTIPSRGEDNMLQLKPTRGQTGLCGHSRILGLVIALGLVCQSLLPGAKAQNSLSPDILYVGDGSDNTVKIFRADDGTSLGTFVASGNGGLDGPRGLIFGRRGTLLVSAQNPDLRINGDILQYSGRGTTATFLGALVTGSPEAVARPRFPQNVACRFPALRSSEDDSQHCESL